MRRPFLAFGPVVQVVFSNRISPALFDFCLLQNQGQHSSAPQNIIPHFALIIRVLTTSE